MLKALFYTLCISTICLVALGFVYTLQGYPGFFDPNKLDHRIAEAYFYQPGNYACVGGDTGLRVPCSENDYWRQLFAGEPINSLGIVGIVGACYFFLSIPVLFLCLYVWEREKSSHVVSKRRR